MKKLGIVLLFLILIGAAVHSVSYYPTTSDDAFISLRYSQNLVDGHGLVYNPGREPVEGFSNPLLVFLTAAFLFLGVPELWILKGIGLAAFVGSVALLAGRRSFSTPLDLAGPALLAASPFAALWSMAGLETSLYAFLILAGVVVASREIGGRRARWTPVVFLLVALSRPEGGLLCFGAFAAQWLLSAARWRVVGGWFVGWGIPFVSLVAARFFYFGSLTPNTYTAKVDAGASAVAKAGDYLLSFFIEGGFWIALPALVVLCVLAAGRRRKNRLILAAVLIVAQIVFLLVVGRDFMPGYRFLMPVYPLTCLLAGDLIVRIGVRFPSLWPRLAAGALVAGLCAGTWASQSDSLAHHKHRFWLLQSGPWTSYLFQKNLEGTWLEGHEKVAAYLRRNAGPRDVLVLGPAGVIPYYSELVTIDLFGLTDTTVAGLVNRKPEEMTLSASGVPTLLIELQQYIYSFEPRWIMFDGHFRADGSFVPRFGSGITRTAEWAKYSLAFTATVYPAEWSHDGLPRVNVLYERRGR